MLNNQIYSRYQPYYARVKERYPLTGSGSTKKTCHLVIDLGNSGITFEPGDSLAVLPSNDPQLVEKTLKALKTSGEEVINSPHEDKPTTLRHFLTHQAEIGKVNKRTLKFLAEHLPNPKLHYLLDPAHREECKAYRESRQLWDLLEEHPTDFDLQDFCQQLPSLHPRLYSVASSLKACPGEVHLIVAVVEYYSNGHHRYGTCSDYLCNRVPLNRKNLPIFIHPAPAFHLPDDPHADIIMVGNGTGIAPFRSFMQERIAIKSIGKNLFFYGERHSHHNFYYKDYWEQLVAEGKLSFHTAFSRDQEDKIYVQDRLREHAAEIWNMLEKGAYFYVCGDALRMARDVDKALHDIIARQGNISADQAREYVKQLRVQKRYKKDVY
ncbi:MAG: diflavin oxidoreductase [Chlamydiota bacterium]